MSPPAPGESFEDNGYIKTTIHCAWNVILGSEALNTKPKNNKRERQVVGNTARRTQDTATKRDSTCERMKHANQHE